MIIVSACLLGENCKYSGGHNYCPKVMKYLADKEFVAVCPELLGGLGVPRSPVELAGDKAINKEGQDLTSEFAFGAAETLRLALANHAGLCLLKEASPSCGVHMIYDGSFSGKRVPGQGLTTRLLLENGFAVISEDDIDDIA